MMGPEVEHAISAIKDSDLANALRIIALVLSTEHQENQRKLGEIKSAHDASFPNADGVAHRLGHEAQTARDHEEAKFWGSLKGKVAAGGVLTTLGVIVSALGYYVLRVIVEHLPK